MTILELFQNASEGGRDSNRRSSLRAKRLYAVKTP